jgi:hypothetical protein
VVPVLATCELLPLTCSPAYRSLKSNADAACNDQRFAVPKPQMFKACQAGYTRAFRSLSTMSHSDYAQASPWAHDRSTLLCVAKGLGVG